MALFTLTSCAGVIVLASIIRLLRVSDLKQRQALLWAGVGLAVVPALYFALASGSESALLPGLVLLLLLGANTSREHHELRRKSKLLAEELSSLRVQAGPAVQAHRCSELTYADPRSARVPV
ncbi:hypothetical protein [Kitasatospora sp. MAP5-34]|uniref:hypothetical protein n=1 Tax=Kitasatospora sp. MAP5-34 TaxID=3035102 RepID=UPI0024752DAD|nr:hypothetical protein [Kitasatospora sp. MAP5-34]MDH6578139.1 hypothetical protein [Kitasatospora sp. MAP5-34]